MAQAKIFTVGHSTHALERLIELLRGHGVEQVADVRRFPGSRRMPHFSAEALAEGLAQADIDHVHIPELGGFRRPARDSPNRGWRNDSFRGYADHMQTREFAEGIDRLVGLGSARCTAVMCAEAAWQRCHRRLVADALTVRGSEVLHIRPDGRLERHAVTPFAESSGVVLTYPPREPALDV